MRFLLPVVMILLTACQSTPPLPSWQSPEGLDHPDLGQIIDLRSGNRLSASQLVSELAGADRVLVGERHDNPDHHALQRWLLEALAQRREQGSLLLEMLNPKQQQKVTRTQAMIERGQWPTELTEALGWERGWDWGLYAPLVKYALAQPYPLLSANLDRSEIMSIYRRKPQLTGAAAAEPVQKVLEAQIKVSHCNMLPEAQLPAMLAVQQQRDRRMAERLQAAPKPAMLLAGAFHVRRDLGVPLHLADQGDIRNTRVLVLAEVGEVLQAAQADFVWFTPAQPQQDYCVGFREKAE
ncbi:MAG TPA: iron(III) ABC transporter [Pseudomonas sp.]|nr:iron(III) ABC transporter [Pseudomonas sp.]